MSFVSSKGFFDVMSNFYNFNVGNSMSLPTKNKSVLDIGAMDYVEFSLTFVHKCGFFHKKK